MRRLLREPLLHFLLGGAALFALYGRAAAPSAEGPERIVVGEERIAALAQAFERTWMRPPTEPELWALVDDHVTEEVLYREARALGLDRDDLVVRRRMRQKMEFLNDGLTSSEPSEPELRAFLAANPERFGLAPRVTFSQVFVARGEGGRAEQRASDVLARLRAGQDPDGLGDATLLPRGLDGASPADVMGAFGAAFAEALDRAPEGAWSGPIASSLGLHLVRVRAREAGRLPELEEVREAVVREWEAERRSEERERFYRELRARYQVEVRMPPSAPPVAGVAAPP